MDQAKRALVERRLKRWEVWSGLWLARLLAVLHPVCGEPRGAFRAWLEKKTGRLAGCIIATIVCHAALRMNLKPRRGFCDPRQSQGISLRATIGSALRAAFKAKTLSGRLEKIRRALDDPERLISRLSRRLRSGMTRHMSEHTRAPIGADAVFAQLLSLAAIHGADTS